jgi:hypothetical protein
MVAAKPLCISNIRSWAHLYYWQVDCPLVQVQTALQERWAALR